MEKPELGGARPCIWSVFERGMPYADYRRLYLEGRLRRVAPPRRGFPRVSSLSAAQEARKTKLWQLWPRNHLSVTAKPQITVVGWLAVSRAMGHAAGIGH